MAVTAVGKYYRKRIYGGIRAPWKRWTCTNCHRQCVHFQEDELRRHIEQCEMTHTARKRATNMRKNKLRMRLKDALGNVFEVSRAKLDNKWSCPLGCGKMFDRLGWISSHLTRDCKMRYLLTPSRYIFSRRVLITVVDRSL